MRSAVIGQTAFADPTGDGRIDGATIQGSGVTVSGNGETTASAWGTITTASGDEATAWGYRTTASGEDATAWGVGSEASGDRATAWGVDTVAKGWTSTAWGTDTVADGGGDPDKGDVMGRHGIKADLQVLHIPGCVVGLQDRICDRAFSRLFRADISAGQLTGFCRFRSRYDLCPSDQVDTAFIQFYHK